MDLGLSGQVAVVTGASKGIGLATVRTLLNEGVRVVAASRKTSPELDALAGTWVHAPVDLMEPNGPAEVVARAVDAFGAVDILVNNAGGPPPGVSLPHGGFLDRTDADWQAMVDFNLFSAVRASRAALGHMLEAGSGAIVNVASANGWQPASFNLDYSAAKAAMINFSKSLAHEFGPRGVRVNSVSPGATRSAWWTEEGGVADMMAAQAGADRDTVLDSVAPEMMAITSGRLVDPQEVADAVCLLASPRSASTIGADVVVDGGLLKSM